MPSLKIVALPLHSQLRSALVQRIVSGEWGPGSAIPNEHDIGREYNLSPGTVRKALEGMERAHLIVRRQGRGTFVIDPVSDDVIRRRVKLRDAAGNYVLGKVVNSKLTKAASSDAEAERLELRPGDEVYRIAQLRMRDGVPYLWEELVLPAHLFAGLEERSQEVNTIGELAFAKGVLVGRGKERVAVALAEEHIATALDVKVGTPLLHLDRVLDTIDEIPAQWRLAWCLPAGVVYEADLN